MLIDAVGGMKLERELIDRMIDAGVRVAPLPPGQALRGQAASANRTHRKILVADGRVGLTGGVGIAEEWTGNAAGPRPLARHARARRRARSCAGCSARSPRTGSRRPARCSSGDGYLPELERARRTAGR